MQKETHMPQKISKKWLGLLLQCVSVGVFAQQLTSVNPDAVAMNTYGADLARAASDQVKVFIYRDAVDYFAPIRPAHLYINDVYVRTLDRKEYSTLCLAPGRYKISSHLEDAFIYSDKNRKHLYGNLNAGETYHIKLNTAESSGGELSQVDRPRVSLDLKDLKASKPVESYQYYLSEKDKQEFAKISQLIQPCREYVAPPAPVAPPPPPAPKPPVVIKRNLMLGADGTFAINRYSLSDLRYEGKNKIDQSLATIRSEGINVSNVNIVGHADRLGNEKRNQFLSQQRSETIKSYLVASGVPHQIITTGSRSSSEPIVSCNQKKRADLVKCLEPNRRISIDFTGTIQQ